MFRRKPTADQLFVCLFGVIFKLLPSLPLLQRGKIGAFSHPEPPLAACQPAPVHWAQITPPPSLTLQRWAYFLKQRRKKKILFGVSHTVCISFVPSGSHCVLQRVPPASAAHCWLSVWFCSAGTAGKLSSMSWETFWSSYPGLDCKQLSGSLNLTSLGFGL